MANPVGVEIAQGFYTPNPNEAIVVNFSRDPDGEPFLAYPDDFETFDSGDRMVRFTPQKIGNYYARGTGAESGEGFRGNWQVVTAAQFDPVSAIGAGTIEVVSPVAIRGNVTIIQGDDYRAVDSWSLPWSTTEEGLWPDLTGATITFLNKMLPEITGVVVQPTGANKAIRVDLTREQTDQLTPGKSRFQVRATLAVTGSHRTLVLGEMTVTSDVSPREEG